MLAHHSISYHIISYHYHSYTHHSTCISCTLSKHSSNLSTYLIHPILSTHPVNPSYQPILSTHPINPSYQPILFTPSYQPILSTHLINPSQQPYQTMRKDVLPRFLNSHYAEELFTNLSLCDPLPVASQLIVDPPHDDSLLPGKSNNINTPYQYALSTHLISTPYPPTLYFPFFFTISISYFPFTFPSPFVSFTLTLSVSLSL